MSSLYGVLISFLFDNHRHFHYPSSFVFCSEFLVNVVRFDPTGRPSAVDCVRRLKDLIITLGFESRERSLIQPIANLPVAPNPVTSLPLPPPEVVSEEEQARASLLSFFKELKVPETSRVQYVKRLVEEEGVTDPSSIHAMLLADVHWLDTLSFKPVHVVAVVKHFDLLDVWKNRGAVDTQDRVRFGEGM